MIDHTYEQMLNHAYTLYPNKNDKIHKPAGPPPAYVPDPIISAFSTSANIGIGEETVLTNVDDLLNGKNLWVCVDVIATQWCARQTEAY